MRDVRPRIEKMEKQLGLASAPGEFDWVAMLALVAKHGKRLVHNGTDA